MKTLLGAFAIIIFIGMNFIGCSDSSDPITPVDISEIYGWLIVIDNGEGSNSTGPDSSSILLFTDGSDIGNQTIVGIDNMEPREFLDWMHDYLLPLYGIPYEAYLAPTDNGNIQVR